MKMKSVLFLALLGTQTATAAELKLVTTSWPPYTGGKGETQVVIDLVKEALRRDGIKARYTVVPEGTMTAELTAKHFDGSPALWKSPDREAFMYYSAPILENRLVLVAKKGTDVNAGSLKELKGKRVGIVTGFAYGKELDDAKDTIFVKASGHQENLKKLAAGEIDYLLIEDLFLESLLENKAGGKAANLVVGHGTMITRTVHLALRKEVPNAQSIIKDFDRKLRALLADGTYNRILELNWIEGDIDGDGKLELIPRSNKIGSEPPTRNYSVFSASVDKDAAPPRYWIDGRVYPSWSAVPGSYKVDETTRREKSEPLLNLQF